MENQIDIVKDVADGMIGIGGIPTNEEFYAEFDFRVRVALRIGDVSGALRYSEREIDFAYLAGVFNVSGIDGLQKEIERIKGLGKNPHDIIIAAREH
jgi:hypothetical protein